MTTIAITMTTIIPITIRHSVNVKTMITTTITTTTTTTTTTIMTTTKVHSNSDNNI